jgi:hypothetical protein
MATGWIRKGVVRARDTNLKQVKWQKISGSKILDERDWPGIWIPIVKVIGNELDIEGETRLSGMVRPAMDSQRMYNYSVSAFVEMVALAPKAPYIAADGQIEDHEDEWSDANRRNISVLPYSPMDVNGALVPPPRREPMPGVPSGWAVAMQGFDNDIQGNMGMYKANLGAESNAVSGKAKMADQREGDTANFNYVDNLSRAMIHSGRILTDLIPKIYDTKRIARILGEDGESDMAQIDPSQIESYKEFRTPQGKKKSYNLNVGKYDVTAIVGASYSTKREEAAQNMVQVTQAYPQLMQIAGDILFKNLDWPGADEVAERIKKTLPPELQDQEDDEQINQLVQQLQQAHQQIQQMGMAMEEMKNEKGNDQAIKAKEVEIKEFDAETKRMKVLIDEKMSEFGNQLNGIQALIQSSQMMNNEVQNGKPQPSA